MHMAYPDHIDIAHAFICNKDVQSIYSDCDNSCIFIIWYLLQ